LRRGRFNHRIAKSLRGYALLKSRNELGKILHILEQISRADYHRAITGKLQEVVGDSRLASLAVRQYLLQWYSSSDFKQKLLEYIGSADTGKFAYAMPGKVIDIVRENGIDVNVPYSRFLWFLHCLKSWLKGSTLCFAILFRSVVTGLSGGNAGSMGGNGHIVLPGITRNSLPNGINSGSYCLVAWFIDKYLPGTSTSPLSDVREIRHNMKGIPDMAYQGFSIRGTHGVLPYPSTIGGIAVFLKQAITSILKALGCLSSGHWSEALLMVDIARIHQCDCVTAQNLPTAVYYNNSAYIFRPLWTYLAEKKGVLVAFYFYSTNIELLNGSMNYGWDIATWTKYLVWDIYQKTFLDKYSPLAVDTEVVGPVYLDDIPGNCPVLPERSVAVFDVQPVRSSFYAQLGLDTEYYIPKISCKFLQDINKAAVDTGFKVILKRKREIGRLAHPKYRKQIEILSHSEQVKEVDASMSPYKILGKVKGVICMPFTSVAHYAVEVGLPAVFYDPSEMLDKTLLDLSHGVPILNNYTELSEWMAAL
jgi:polysaccharide biosynthesis PFTS motif protein